MNYKKHETLKVLTIFLVTDILAELLFGISLPAIIISNIIVGIAIFKPKNIYIKITLVLLAGVSFYLAAFVFN